MSGCDSRQPHQPSPAAERQAKTVASKRLARRQAFIDSVPGYGLAGQFPTSRAPACAAESPKLSLPGAAPGRLANFLWGRGRKVMHLPCKQAQAGALPAVLHQPRSKRSESRLPRRSEAKAGHDWPHGRIYFELRLGKPFHCGENQIRASLISSASAGATPAPATNFREVIQLPDCKSGVTKQNWK